MATIINDDLHVEVQAQTDGARWLMAPSAFEALTGWTLKPEGLCKGDVCAPLFHRDAVLDEEGRIDLAGAAPLVGLSAVVDNPRSVAAVAPAAAVRAEAMASLQAPDFTLNNLAGEPVSLHDFNRRKVLLLAWSSW